MKPKLLPSQILYRCNRCRSPLTHAEALVACYSCGATDRQPGFRFTDREIAEAKDRGFICTEENFTFVDDRLVREAKLPALDQLFRADEWG